MTIWCGACRVECLSGASGIRDVSSSQQYCVFGKVASLEMVFVRSGSAHDEGRLSHLKNYRNSNCDFRGAFES